MRAMLLILILFTAPAWAQEALLEVNQTHTLAWDWAKLPDTGPAQAFVFRCGQYAKVIEDPGARSLRFGSLVEAPGRYEGCTLSARNDAGLSPPVAVPPFVYAYSYQALGLFLLELAAMLGAVTGLAATVYRRVRRPLMLPEPLVTMDAQKEATHAAHDA